MLEIFNFMGYPEGMEMVILGLCVGCAAACAARSILREWRGAGEPDGPKCDCPLAGRCRQAPPAGRAVEGRRP